MRGGRRQWGRRGSILPLVVLSVAALCGFVALAVDVGLVALAKAQCQNAADAAALAACRNLDGTAQGNQSAATAAAQAAAAANRVLGQPISPAEVTVRHGAYHYDSTTQTFAPQVPPAAPDNYNLSEVTVTHTIDVAFARVFNPAGVVVTATATAAHRPRDVVIVLDYSGSMNNESDLWNNEGYLGSVNNSSNNADPVFPQFGPYDPTFSPRAALQQTGTDPRVGRCNVSAGALGIPALVADFFQNARGAAAGTPAFAPAPAGVTVTSPGGDVPPSAQGTTTPARNWAEVTGSPTVGFNGYPSFKGYTQGPGYWGMTFFIWPPDPRPANDWRKKFFFLSDGATPLNDNTKLFSTSSLNDPPGNYVINYKGILAWIKANAVQATPGDGRPFPALLRAGRVVFYDAIPDDVPAAAYDHTQPNANITDANQRFWKEYIDYTLGVWRDPYGNIQRPGNPSCSYGPDFTSGSPNAGEYVQVTGPDKPDPNGRSYVAPQDNPKRPRHRFWFGPITLVQFLSDTGLLPGTAHDISMVAAKLGVKGALQDVQNNHPGDQVALVLFSRPHYQGEPAAAGQFTQPVAGLSRDYAGMIDALFYPPNSATADVRLWDANDVRTPRAHGDYCANTATSYGFMLAYNQLSSNAALRAANVGGLGRKGAQRLVILETDGMANQATQADFTGSGAYDSYYNIRPGDTFTASGADPAQDAVNVVQRICALTTDTANGPGFATPSKPVAVHCIAFGAVFEPTASGGEADRAIAFLQQVSAVGGTGFPPSVTAASDPNYYKLCIGTLDERQAKLRQAFTKIMDEGVGVILVR